MRRYLLLPAAAVVVAVVVLGAGCDGAAPATQRSTGGTAGATRGVDVPECASDNRYGDVGNELTGAPGSFAALLFGPEVRVGVPIKIAFKIPGSGDLTLRAEGPDGTAIQPDERIRHTGGSNWQRPGEEWGSKWTFPAAGCWIIRAERSDGTHAALPLRAA